MSYLTDRRRFLKTTALTGVGVFVAGTAAAEDSKSPNERIRFACIGVGGKGASDSNDARQHGDVVAICDIDDSTLDKAASKSFPNAQPVQRLPQDARRDGQEHRRRHRQHARPHARRGLGHGHADGQGLLHAEAADAHDLRSPQAGRDRPRDESRHADGQPGHGQQLAAQDRRDRARRRVGQRQGSPRLDQSPDLAAGRRASRAEAPVPPNVHWDLWLGPAPERPYARRLSSVRLARLVGFRHRRPGRHGLPHGQHAVHGARPARPDRRAGRRPRATTRTAIPSGRSSTSISRPTTTARP